MRQHVEGKTADEDDDEPALKPTATVQTIANMKTRCGWALPTDRYGLMVSSKIAVTVAPIAATNRDVAVDPRRLARVAPAVFARVRDARCGGDVGRSIPRALQWGNAPLR